MLKFIVLVAIIVVAQSARIPRETKDAPIEILKSESETHEDGSYSYSYESADGSSRQEKAVAMNVGTDEAYLLITGSYKYIDGDGKPVEVSYAADQKGFVPTGTIISEEISNAAQLAHDEAKPDDWVKPKKA